MTDHATQASAPAADLPADAPTRSLAVASVDAPGVPIVGVAGGAYTMRSNGPNAVGGHGRWRRRYRTEMLGP